MSASYIYIMCQPVIFLRVRAVVSTYFAIFAQGVVRVLRYYYNTSSCYPIMALSA